MRGRTNPKNWQSAAQSTGRGKSRRLPQPQAQTLPGGGKGRESGVQANVDFQYHKALHDNPQIAGNPLPASCRSSKSSGSMQRRQGKAAQKRRRKPQRTPARRQKRPPRKQKKAIAFVGRHPAGVCIAVAALLLFIMVSAGLSSCGSMFSGLMNGILGTSYTSEDSDLVATENNYAAKEAELQQQIDNIESTTAMMNTAMTLTVSGITP